MISARKLTTSLSRLMADFAHIEEAQDCDVSGVAMDSRAVKSGDIFLACRGANGATHGVEFCDMAIAKGAIAIAVDDEGSEQSKAISELRAKYDLPIFPVRGLNQKAGLIAARFFGQPSQALNVFGITGTNGKTSVSQFLAQCFTSLGRPCGVIGTLGSGMWGSLHDSGHTTPSAVAVQQTIYDMSQQQASELVMEVSSHGLEQGRVNGVEFNVAVLTNLSRDHLDYHGTMENYALAKALLFKQSQLTAAVLNLDDAFGRNLCRQTPDGVERVGYSLELDSSELVDKLVSGRIASLGHTGIVMDVTSPWGGGEIRSSLLGRFNAQNILAVLCSLLVSGVSFKQAANLLAEIKAPPGRMETFQVENAPLVVVDYAHTPDALENVLATLREHCQGEVWVVFGCGGNRDRGKRPQMGAIAETFANRVIVTDDNPRRENAQQIVDDILSGIRNIGAIRVEHDREQAIMMAIQQAATQDMVLIAGKGHEDYQIVGDEVRHFSDKEVVERVLGVAA
ncbi:MAG: UDP-N-acetylmuramoyl-L-alanyl-D-glutamate--2,6-diaminopimelate ligase [Gammaproteobacteria bacterium]|nr:UDP-N-acetylmuramoyl-L-alanyl-D-glutamate--2,6-diaminopimelate ligase [Gammaproteobacteria bacterium]